MRCWTALGTALLVTLAQACGGGQKQPPPPAHQAQEAATQGIETLRQMITEQNYRAMGFQSVDEVKSAALGAPLPIFYVQLDQLKSYEPATDPNKLLTDVNQMMYPVTVKDEVRSSVVVAKADGVWKATRFGGPNVIQSVAQVRSTVARSSETPPASTFVVRVPALNFYFLGYRAGDKLMLAPLLDDSRYNFKAGVPMPAEEAFRALAAAAKNYNGLPI